MLELGGLQLEESLLGGGVRELEGVEVAAGVGALFRVELCYGFFSGRVGNVSTETETLLRADEISPASEGELGRDEENKQRA